MSEFTKRHISPAEYTWKDIVRITVGVIMFIVGIAGLILPILNGTLFLLFSAFVLAPYSRRVRRWLDYGERKFPWLSARARKFNHRLQERSRAVRRWLAVRACMFKRRWFKLRRHG